MEWIGAGALRGANRSIGYDLYTFPEISITAFRSVSVALTAETLPLVALTARGMSWRGSDSSESESRPGRSSCHSFLGSFYTSADETALANSPVISCSVDAEDYAYPQGKTGPNIPNPKGPAAMPGQCSCSCAIAWSSPFVLGRSTSGPDASTRSFYLERNAACRCLVLHASRLLVLATLNSKETWSSCQTCGDSGTLPAVVKSSQGRVIVASRVVIGSISGDVSFFFSSNSESESRGSLDLVAKAISPRNTRLSRCVIRGVGG